MLATDTRPDSVINCCPNCESRPNYSDVQDVTILDCGDRFCMSCEARWSDENRAVITDSD
jgi:formate dehydrogenase maturation protein FdhE